MLDPRPYSISDSRVSRFSPSEPWPSLSPVCTKHPRQSPSCLRTTLQQCGHSSGSCEVGVSESVRSLRSIFHCPSPSLAAECAPFIRYRQAIRPPEAISVVTIGWVP